MSSRRNTSLVVALGVGALAATSLAAMVATSELLAESFGRPVSGRLEPSAPGPGRPDVIQVAPPGRGRGGLPGGRSRATAAGSPPRRRATPGSPAEAGARPEAAGGSVVVAVLRRPSGEDRVAVLPSAVEQPAAPPAPRPTRPHRPDRPRPAGPGGGPNGGSPCPDRPGRDDGRRGSEDRDRHGRDRRRHWHDGHAGRPDRDRHGRHPRRHRRDDDRRWHAGRDHHPDRHHRRHCHRHHGHDRR